MFSLIFLALPIASAATLTIYTKFSNDYAIVIMDPDTKGSIKTEKFSAPPEGKYDISFETTSSKVNIGLTTYQFGEKKDFTRYDDQSTSSPIIIDLTNGTYVETPQINEELAANNTPPPTQPPANLTPETNATPITENKTSLQTVTGFAVEDTNPGFLSKYKWWVIGAIIVIVIIALIIFFMRKRRTRGPAYLYPSVSNK